MRSTLPPLTLGAWLRLDAISPFLERFPQGARVLEIGAGLGGFGCRLAQRFDYTGVELDRTSWELAVTNFERSGRGRILHGDIAVVPSAARFDVVCAFEVLEHIEDDEEALTQWSQRLVGNGIILVSVPAFRSRFGRSDVRVGHYRRYDPQELRRKLEAVGFAAPELKLYGFPLGLLLDAARNTIAGMRPSTDSAEARTRVSGRWFQPSRRLGWATRLASRPFQLLQRPFYRSGLGTGLVAFARLPK